MKSKIITRQLIASRIDSLLQGKISVSQFGEEMFGYLAFEDKYKLEDGYEEQLREALNEFMDMHDVGQGRVGYEPYVPSNDRLTKIKKMLMNTTTK